MQNKSSGITPLNWVKRKPKRNNSPGFLLRMCRHTLLAYLCFLTLINVGRAQTMHQRNWVVGDKMFNFSPLASAGAAPTIARTFPTRVNAAPVNAMSDRSGNLFFYIRDYKIYNASHAVIGTLPDPGPQDITTFVTGGEVSIVPFVENSGCTSRYYIFYIHMDRTAKKVNLRTKIASVDLLTSEVTITDYLFGGSPVNLATTNFVPIVGHSNEFYGSGGLAASKETGGKRYLYFVSEYKVQKITITDGSGTNYGLSAALSINADSSKYYSATQAQLSDDGTKLAWASSDTSFGASSYFHIIGINTPNGNWDGTFSTFKAPAGAGFGELSARGVCFNDAGTKLFVTTGYPFYLAPDHTKHGIYVYDIAAGTGTLIPNSNKYGTSQLAKAANGLIYARSSQDICAIDPDTALIIDTLPMRADFDSTEWTIRYMPDQINGELADSMPDLGIDSLNISSTTVLGVLLENTTLRIKNSINVTGIGTNFTMRSYTVELGENASINLGRGTSFNPEICTFKAFDIPGCPQHKKMWKGIVAHSPDSGILINLPVGPTIIQDAIIGIDADGPNVLVWYSAEMRANETHLSAKNGAVMLGSCGNCDTNAVIFYGDIPLRDQSKGSSNGYSDGLKRTIQHVYIDNGYLGPGKGITFQGGQYGFYVDKLAWGEELTAQKFAGQKKAGIYISNSFGKNFSLNNLHFTDLENGIVMRNCKQSNFYLFSSTFTNVSKYGIDANGSHGSEFFIGAGTGDPFAFDRGNTFTNTGWAAVYLHNNADPNLSRIFIRRNTIGSSVEGSKGIVISEGSGGDKKYSELLIDYNSISNTYTGPLYSSLTNKPYAIQLVNAIGKNPRNPVKRDIGAYAVSHINNNSIAVSPVLIGDQALEIAASGGNSFFENNITGTRYGRAIRITNSQNTLYHGNTSTTGFGLLADGSMLNSNYYCNTISNAYTGITLRNHWLRNSYFKTHGDSTTGARDNNFSQRPTGKPYSSIHLDNSQTGLNQWKFSTTWGLPIITSTGSTGIFAGYEANVCGVPGTPGSGGGGGESPSEITEPVGIFWERYGRQQQYLLGYDSLPDSNDNVVKLLDAENLISLGEDDAAALAIVNSIVVTPSAYDEEMMADYKLLYQTYLAYRMADTTGRNMNDSMVAILTTIAEKNPVTESPAAHSARAILWDERHLEFGNEPEASLVLGGYLLVPSCSTSVLGLPVYLVHEDGDLLEGPVFTDTDGEFAFGAGLAATYSSDNNLYKLRMILADGSTIESAAATVTELALQSDHELSCASASEPLLIAGLVHATGCPENVTDNIMAYLLKQSGDLVEGPVMVSPSGNFSFNPVLTALHNNSNLYKIRLIFADATMAETTAATIADLAAASIHEFNCPDEPPIILPKKGNDKEPLNYKEETNVFAQQLAFNVSPNPSAGLFHIAGVGSTATATLTNTVGQVVLKDLPLISGKLDASNLKAGIYILTVTDQHNSHVQKINIIK